MSKEYEVQSTVTQVVIAKGKTNNHKKPAKPHTVDLKANAKLTIIWLSCKRHRMASPITFKATVETDNLLIARIEAAKAARGLGLGSDMVELNIETKGWTLPT